jgi:hypothetical protein
MAPPPCFKSDVFMRNLTRGKCPPQALTAGVHELNDYFLRVLAEVYMGKVLRRLTRFVRRFLRKQTLNFKELVEVTHWERSVRFISSILPEGCKFELQTAMIVPTHYSWAICPFVRRIQAQGRKTKNLLHNECEN